MRLSDRLLAELEELNWSTFRDGELAGRINELLVQAGQEGKLPRLRSTADALAAVYRRQDRLFGPEDIVQSRGVHSFGPRTEGTVGLVRSRQALSGGEKSRLARGRVARLGPNILMLDEPTNNADPASSEEMLPVSHDDGAVQALQPQRVVLTPDGIADWWGASLTNWCPWPEDELGWLPKVAISHHLPRGSLVDARCDVRGCSRRRRRGGPPDSKARIVRRAG